MKLIEEFLRLVEQFEAQRVEYAVCGGIAVGIYGYPRLTIDIDFLIPEAALEDAKRAATAAGFDFETGWIPIPDKTAPRVFRVLKIAGEKFISLDLMLVNETNQAILENRQRLVVDGIPVNVVSRDNLIQMKVNSTRSKDKLDVEELRKLSEGEP